MVCTKEYTQEEIKTFIDYMKKDYRVNWIVDSLPGAILREFQSDLENEGKSYYEPGYPLGVRGDLSPDEKELESYFLNNHVHMKFLYNQNPIDKSVHITGFIIEPESIQYHHTEEKPSNTCLSKTGSKLSLASSGSDTLKVVWSYSVTWEESLTEWVQRWDKYAQSGDTKIHWFSIINSLMIVLFLTGIVAMIMMRTLHADFRRYNRSIVHEDIPEETGWKLVAADVFRVPNYPMALSVLAGTGMHYLESH